MFNYCNIFSAIRIINNTMSKPAARISDMHTCPMVTPGTPPVPHVGGPVSGPGVASVLIDGMPAAVMGDQCTCAGPPDTIVLGSTGVLIGGKPAARMGDATAHGGVIAAGCPTVLIGEVSGGIANMPIHIISVLIQAMPGETGNQLKKIATLKDAADQGVAFIHQDEVCPCCGQKHHD